MSKACVSVGVTMRTVDCRSDFQRPDSLSRIAMQNDPYLYGPSRFPAPRTCVQPLCGIRWSGFISGGEFCCVDSTLDYIIGTFTNDITPFFGMFLPRFSLSLNTDEIWPILVRIVTLWLTQSSPPRAWRNLWRAWDHYYLSCMKKYSES